MREPETGSTRLLVLWDVDHTLVDNGGTSKATYALAFELLTGRPARHRARTDGRTDAAVLAELLGDHGLTLADHPPSRVREALAAAGAALRDQLLRDGRALPGAADSLRRLGRQPGVVQSVLTGNIEANARLKLTAFGLADLLDLELGAYGDVEVDRGRLVDAARQRARARGLDPGRDATVLVGDTPRDVAAARAGTVRVVAVATGRHTASELAAAGADEVLPDLRDAGAVVATLRRVGGLPSVDGGGEDRGA